MPDSTTSLTTAAPDLASGPQPPRPSWVRRCGPGLALAIAVALAAYAVSTAVPALSASLISIVIGAVLSNLGWTDGVLRPGLDVAAKPVLRLGIILLGLQLALGDIIALGPLALIVIVAVVGLGLGSGILLGRALRIPLPQTLLIACGFSICGAAAVAAAEGVMIPERRAGESRELAEERLETQTATAVALVVVFGTLMIPLVPIASSLLGLAPAQAGLWGGASIHEVAQVAAAGTLIGHGALADAVLVKLGRVLLLAPVMAVIAVIAQRHAAAHGHVGSRTETTRPPLVPLWILGFVVAVAIRSLGIIPTAVFEVIKPVQGWCLAAAMFALGTGVRWRLLRAVGGRPVVLGLLTTIIVTAIGLVGAYLAV